MSYVPYTYASMSDSLPPASQPVPAAPSFKPAQRQRRRRRRNGNKKQTKMQQAQHSEVLDRLDKIRVLLQVTVNEIIGSRLDRQNSRTNTYGNSPSSSYLPPFTADSPKDSTAIDPDKLTKLAESFFLLEMELNLTRDRLRDLRALVGSMTDGYLRAGLLELMDNLAQSIDSDLARLCIITQQQYDAGLTDHVPHANRHSTGPGGSAPVASPSHTRSSALNGSTTACGTPRSGDTRSTGVWEWVNPDLSPPRPSAALPIRTWHR